MEKIKTKKVHYNENILENSPDFEGINQTTISLLLDKINEIIDWINIQESKK